MLTGNAIGSATLTLEAAGYVAAEVDVSVVPKNEFVRQNPSVTSIRAGTRLERIHFRPLRAVGAPVTATIGVSSLGGSITLNPRTLTWGPSDWMVFKSTLASVINEGDVQVRVTAEGFEDAVWNFDARGEYQLDNAIILSATAISVPNTCLLYTSPSPRD